MSAAAEHRRVGDWRVEQRSGRAQELHDAAASDAIDGRAVVIQSLQRPALVLGSTQASADVDEGRLAGCGIELARRRSGGGAVLLVPDDHVWVDLVVPADDPLADDDVERAAWWVGALWVRALSLGGGDVDDGVVDDGVVDVRRRGVSDRSSGAVACFAAVGPGEVSVGGRKVLGISQRRTRHGARFQCVAYRSWEPDLLLSVLAPGRGDGGTGVSTALIERAGAVVPTGWSVDDDLLSVLP